MTQLIDSYEGDADLAQVIVELAVANMGPNEYELSHGLLKYRGRWVVGSQGNLRKLIYEELHEKGVGGHSGVRATLKRIEQYFFWVGMRRDITEWIAECSVCQFSPSMKM